MAESQNPAVDDGCGTTVSWISVKGLHGLHNVGRVTRDGLAGAGSCRPSAPGSEYKDALVELARGVAGRSF